jgi:hypothetical protein
MRDAAKRMAEKVGGAERELRTKILTAFSCSDLAAHTGNFLHDGGH